MPVFPYSFGLACLGAIAACLTLTAAAAEPLRFEFRPNQPPAAGVVAVPEGTLYTPERRHGFEHADSTGPAFFSVAVAEGNYKVTVTLGDATRATETTLKAELRRLMLENVRTAPGQFTERSFIVNVRTPRMAGGGRVKLKSPRETRDEAWAWDERLTLEFNGAHPGVAAIAIEAVSVPTVYLLGDSTVCDQSKEPYASWGQMLPRFFKPEVAVANHAESGETLRGATALGRFAKVQGDLKPGDYVFIQFGHNDMKSKEPDALAIYKAALVQWVDAVRAKGAIPVLVTSVERHRFDAEGVPQDSLGEYPATVRAVAAEHQAALIDLHAMSKTFYQAMGPKAAVLAFKHNSPDDPRFDATHHSPYGAYELAKCIAVGIAKARLPLAASLGEEIAGFDPARPDPAEGFRVPASPGFTNERPLGD